MINAKCHRPKSLAHWLCELLKPRRPTPIVRNNPHGIISFHERRHEQHLLEKNTRGAGSGRSSPHTTANAESAGKIPYHLFDASARKASLRLTPTCFRLEVLQLRFRGFRSKPPGQCFILLRKPTFSLLCQRSLGGDEALD